MNVSKGLLFLSVLALSACAAEPPPLGPDGLPLPQLYQISASDASRITFGVLDQVNALRAAAGVPALALSPELNAAAATHSRDMSVQNRPWHFGSDGSSPLDRGMRAGYAGKVLGENISETYETETETLSAWMAVRDTRDVIMNPSARDLGFAWYQEPSGKIWWTLVTGGGAALPGALAAAN
ncbi:CAP domain-containing protein [Phaeovulum sp.]|uniref:CAP domain-containing protein n=1 Tax=Phaeovulum sp. TaxID=2934796 RepID=UPI0035694A69